MKVKIENHDPLTNSMNSAVPVKKINRFKQLLSYIPMSWTKYKPVVAILRLEGIIGKAGSFKSGITLNGLNKLIEQMFDIDKLESICLCINSPGGSPVQSELIASRIINLAKAKRVPVYAFVEDVAASGGYWLACAADKIFVSKSSVVGSIGVISAGFGFDKAIEKHGIERRIYTQGNSKSVLDPFKPVKEEDVKVIKSLQKQIHTHFIDTVKSRRSRTLNQSDEILFNGEFWSGQTAVDYGLADGISDLYSFINERYGDTVKIEYIEEKQSWFKKKFSLEKTSQDFSQELIDNLIDSVESKLIHNKFNLK